MKKIATSPIPEERIDDPEVFTGDMEISIRALAVDGITKLAKTGIKEAEQLLRNFSSHDNAVIRRRAAHGYLSLGGDLEHRAVELRALLPDKDHAFINLEVSQPPIVADPRTLGD